MAIARWRFIDEYTQDEFEFPFNPTEMDPLGRQKTLTLKTTTPVHGKTVLFEGNKPYREWSFRGTVRHQDFLQELDHWMDKNHPIKVRDHFTREIKVYLLRLALTPRGSNKLYWKHDYKITCQLLREPSFPTDPAANEPVSL